jgi:hypothetical protein
MKDIEEAVSLFTKSWKSSFKAHSQQGSEMDAGLIAGTDCIRSGGSWNDAWDAANHACNMRRIDEANKYLSQ